VNPRFRCEVCGYSLNGLPDDALCPECATPARDSRPELHPGSPWQQHPTFANWFRTLAALITRPSATFRALRIEPRRWRALFWLNMGIASLIFLPGFFWELSRGPLNLHFIIGPRHEIDLDANGSWCIALAVMSIVILPPVLPLAARLSKTVRAAQMSRLAIRVANAHVSFLWVAAALAWTLGFALRRALIPDAPIQSPISLERFAYFVADGLPKLMLLAAVMALSWIDYVGTRVCRFANDLPASEAAAAPKP
jgi:hypothetical protein